MMKRRLDELSENVSELGTAGLDLFRAEAAALSADLKLSTRALVKLLLLCFLAVSIVFWAIAVFVYLAIEVTAFWLPRWASALTVLGLLLLLVVAIGLFVWRRFGRLETPKATVQRRFADLLEWWQRKAAGRGRGI